VGIITRSIGTKVVTSINLSQLVIKLPIFRPIPTTILTQSTLPAKMADTTRRKDSIVVATVVVAADSLVVGIEVAIVGTIVAALVTTTTKRPTTLLISSLNLNRNLSSLKMRKKPLRTMRNNLPRANTTLSFPRRNNISTSFLRPSRRKSLPRSVLISSLKSPRSMSILTA